MSDDLLAQLARAPLDPRLRESCAEALLARGDPRGRFLALDAELAATRAREPAFRDRQLALDELARALDPDWLARIGALSHRRVHPWRPGAPRAGGLRAADLAPLPAQLALDDAPATRLQSLRWTLPGPLLEIAVHDGDASLDCWTPRVYWSTRPPHTRSHERRVVELREAPPDRVQGIRLIRELAGCDLRSARDHLDRLPCVLRETYDSAELEAVLARVAAVGGRASVDGRPWPPGDLLLGAGSSLLEAGEPVLVILRADPDHLEVRDFGIRWTGAHENERTHPLRTRWRWSDLPDDPAALRRAVLPAIEENVAARRASFTTCRYCQRLTPPEWQHAIDICSGCAEKHLGVVH